ncbi:ParB-like dsDNA partitioning protein [Mycobacterium phage ExplosioNervosa]|uniref:Arc-like repressor n=1 Tax=Mycobacterium phage Pioneer TaxID=1698417 RepID=UPI0006BCD7AC|nr:Arc-like repressor [Mycobacterium phage Pioneer]AVI04197.1 ParB-like dsDNA partitioning protein [Mycobacterium phage Phonnegut]AZF93514.1 ParB-like dsDNA partitioning protein [Mycobacterium phage ExplosioNervosa]QFG11548.1 ParB-like dsDNA partitioning protein [Mycobacterium phage Maminiaina]QFG14943.1 ParB-like dsDNA partitioning protein [Mycobacterium phage BogosyJay]QGJ88688.1 ParB-like dsDNA partitioning protein [Mycobacterium phage Beemo]
MSEETALQKAQRIAKENRAAGVQPKKASEILRRGPEMVTLGIYLPKGTVADLKRLAFEEETSVSAIVDELIKPRIAAGPRPKEPEYPRFDLT